MKVFITGSTGLLGSHILRLSPKNIKLGASYNINKLVPNLKCQYYHIDINKKKMVDKAIHHFKPQVLIHTAAIASPDYCDKHQEEAYEVNVCGTRNLLNACQKHKTKLVYITTNGIYDGKNPPYDENSKANPIDWYGKTKYKAELLVKNSKTPHLIIRLMTMYGWNNPKERQNPVTWLLKILGKNKTPINMVTDMYNNFLYTHLAALTIWKAIRLKKESEIYNVAGKNCISRYDFSKQISQVFKLDHKMIYPVKLSFFKNFVDRPKNTCFDTKKAQKILKSKAWSTLMGLKHMQINKLGKNSWKKI